MPNCDYKCEGCGVDCSERRAPIAKLSPNEDSSIKRVIGILSGKGGVGKSFVTSMIATELCRQGYKVGILDGDITGPSIPKAFNIHEKARGDGHRYIFPALTKTGIKIISSNMLLDNEDVPIIWRGVLLSNMLNQFFTEVLWEELNYLLIDLPPGTTDITLTCFQKFPLDGIIVVSSPQDLVNMVVSKSINMAKECDIKVLGLIENMAYLNCPHCNEKIEIYGKSRLLEISEKYNVEALGEIPIMLGTSEAIDKGLAETLSINEVKDIVTKILKRLEDDKN